MQLLFYQNKSFIYEKCDLKRGRYTRNLRQESCIKYIRRCPNRYNKVKELKI